MKKAANGNERASCASSGRAATITPWPLSLNVRPRISGPLCFHRTTGARNAPDLAGMDIVASTEQAAATSPGHNYSNFQGFNSMTALEDSSMLSVRLSGMASRAGLASAALLGLFL